MTVPLEQIPYVDFPEIHINVHERTEMPFRYVTGNDGQPIMPKVCYVHRSCIPTWLTKQGMMELIKKDADKGVDDLF